MPPLTIAAETRASDTRISPARMSQAYSVHIFAGFAGTAATPAAVFLLAAYLGWRGAFLAAAALGIVVAAAIMLLGEAMTGAIAPVSVETIPMPPRSPDGVCCLPCRCS